METQYSLEDLLEAIENGYYDEDSDYNLPPVEPFHPRFRRSADPSQETADVSAVGEVKEDDVQTVKRSLYSDEQGQFLDEYLDGEGDDESTLEKRPMGMLRLGKRPMGMLRLGKRPMGMLRLGKRPMSMLRLGKRPMSMLRLGKRPMNMLRLGKRDGEEDGPDGFVDMPEPVEEGADEEEFSEDKRPMSMLRLGKRPMSMLRLGKRPMSMLRLGKRPMNMLRLGKRPMSMLRLGKRPMSMLRLGKRDAE
nr:hypothetical protein BaRGS_007642 [Batillaria attramentaria]